MRSFVSSLSVELLYSSFDFDFCDFFEDFFKGHKSRKLRNRIAHGHLLSAEKSRLSRDDPDRTLGHIFPPNVEFRGAYSASSATTG